MGYEMFVDKKLVIFDLDGTLVDSVPDLALAINDMLRALERKTFSVDTIRAWVGNGAQTLVKRALDAGANEETSLESELFTKALTLFLASYEKHLCEQTICYPNVLITLQALKSKGFILALVTNKPYAFIDPLLKGLGLDELFTLCLGGDSLSKKKPDPMPLLEACKVLEVDPKEAVMIGDSKNDILAAKAAKIQSIGVSYGYNYNEEIETYLPEAVVDDIYECVALLGES